MTLIQGTAANADSDALQFDFLEEPPAYPIVVKRSEQFDPARHEHKGCCKLSIDTVPEC